MLLAQELLIFIVTPTKIRIGLTSLGSRGDFSQKVGPVLMCTDVRESGFIHGYRLATSVIANRIALLLKD